MNIPNIHEHLTCYNYEHTHKPVIEDLFLTAGNKMGFISIYNKIIFIRQEKKEQILFLPAGKEFHYMSSGDSNIVIFRLMTPVSLCMGYSPEMLYKEGFTQFNTPDYSRQGKQIPGSIGLLPPVTHFLEGVSMGIANGMKCRCWFELKTSEFFMLLRVYYPKEELYRFLYPAISGDNEFSKRVLRHWPEHPSVEQLSAFMNMTTRQLSARFMAVFGSTPGKWIVREKAQLIHQQIICTTKPFNQIATENRFATESVFTHFCIREFGKTPSKLRENKK